MSRTRSCLAVGAGALVLGIVLYVGVTMIASRAIIDQSTKSRQLLEAEELVCPEGTELASRPWSKGGWMIFCQRGGVEHGPWLTARAGRLSVRGDYTKGEKSGTWEWYGDDGLVVRRETYPPSPP